MKKIERKSFLLVGKNAWGQLGLGHNRNEVTVPTEIPTPAAAKGFTLTDVQSDWYSTFLICENAQKEKKFFACGLNEYGQLGLGHNNEVTVPTEIATPASALGFTLAAVQIRGSSTFLICENEKEKKLFACGWNERGQLGLGHNEDVTVPTEIVTPKAAEGFTLTDVQLRGYVHF